MKTVSKKQNLSYALAAATEYADTARRYGSNHARCRQLEDNIYHWVGVSRNGKWALPKAVREAMVYEVSK